MTSSHSNFKLRLNHIDHAEQPIENFLNTPWNKLKKTPE